MSICLRFVFILFFIVPLPSYGQGPVRCQSVYRQLGFQDIFSHLSVTRILDRSDPDVQGTYARLRQGSIRESDLLNLFYLGDPVRIAASRNWSQKSTEDILWRMVEVLNRPDIQSQVRRGELRFTRFFSQSSLPWLELVPRPLLEALVASSLGGNMAQAPGRSVEALAPRFVDLLEMLGPESPTLQALAVRVVDSPRVLGVSSRWSDLPQEAQLRFNENWRLDTHNEAMVWPESRLLTYRQKQQMLKAEELQLCGNCPEMARGHFLPFMPGRNGQGTSLIFYQGELIGLLKTTGDPSFMALRDVVNSAGDLVLVTGGVYMPPRWMQELLQINGSSEAVAPLQRIEISEAQPFGLEPFGFYPIMFTKSPVELWQASGFPSFLGKPRNREPSIRRSYGFPLGGHEVLRGTDFKRGVEELRNRALQYQ